MGYLHPLTHCGQYCQGSIQKISSFETLSAVLLSIPSGTAGLHGNSTFNFLRNQNCFHNILYHFSFSPAMKVPILLTFSPKHIPLFFLLFKRYNGHPIGYEVIYHCGSELYLLMTHDMEHLFTCILTVCLFSLESNIKVLCPFFNWSF